MPDARNLTPEEAQDLLIKQQERRKKRQREYRERWVAKGCAKVNTFLTPEASEILQYCRDGLNLSVSEALSEALLAFKCCEFGQIKPFTASQIKSKAPKDIRAEETKTPAPKSIAKKFDRNAAIERIGELRSQKLSWAKIVNTLNAEKMPTAKGRPWQQSSVRKLYARFEETNSNPIK